MVLVCALVNTFYGFRMSTIGDRLREERQRLDLNQTQFGERGGVQKRAQINYEASERMPDAAYLSAIAQAGADVRYIITGERDGSPPLVLSPDEQVLVDGYRELDSATRKRMLAFVLGGEPTSAKRAKTIVHSSVGNTMRDNKGKLEINMGEKKK